MPAKRRPSSLCTSLKPYSPDPFERIPPAIVNIHHNHSALTSHLSVQSDTLRRRASSLRSSVRNEVFHLNNTSRQTLNIPPAASRPISMVSIAAMDIPSYISSRSANSLISFSRPTRIQAKTLLYLNKILDELLLHILTSAKSLATDRIKTDGILKVLGGQSGSGSGAGALLAKNAVLEAELELRNYLDGQRKEGGKMPLGLSATSRWDGTDTFPVQKAYEALRIRCQYYSTLGELEDPSPHAPPDQNIMSSDGRPIATITPGVAIYVTALLEFVAEYILQNIGKIIERDNSDEAGLSDLRKALEEDEGSVFWWNKLSTKGEIESLEIAEQDKAGKGRVGKPWKVPASDEWDEPAGKRHEHRQSIAMSVHNTKSPVTTPVTETRGYSSMSLSGHGSRDSTMMNGNRVSGPLTTSASHHADLMSLSNSSESPVLSRRVSSDKGWFGKKRNSVRESTEVIPNTVIVSAPSTTRAALSTTNVNSLSLEEAPGSDDFDSIMMSGQTMKVSLTPNRLRSIQVSGEVKEAMDEEVEIDGKKNSRKRPGTLSPTLYREAEPTTPRNTQPSPSFSMASRMSLQQQEAFDELPPRSGSRQSSINAVRNSKLATKGAAPPSAYKGPDTSRSVSSDYSMAQAVDENRSTDDEKVSTGVRSIKEIRAMTSGSANISPKNTRLLPRDEIGQRESTVRDMVNMFNTAPPPSASNLAVGVSNGGHGKSSENLLGYPATRKAALSNASGKVKSLFNRKLSASGSSTSLASGFSRRGESPEMEKKLQRPSSRGNILTDSPISQSRSTSTSEYHTSGSGNGTSFTSSISAAKAGVNEKKDLPKPDVGFASSINVIKDQQRASNSVSLEASSLVQRTTDSQEEREDDDDDTPANRTPIERDDPLRWSQDASAVPIQQSDLIGLYRETQGEYAASEISSSNVHLSRTDPPSRKVPWSYSRQSSNGSRRLSGTIPPINRVGSVGSGSISQASANEGNTPPSAWSHIQSSIKEDLTDSNASSAIDHDRKTPTPSATPTFASASPRSPLVGSRPSDTARVLSQLNQKMKGASSVDECRFLLTQALAAAANAVRNEVDNPGNSSGPIRSSSALSWQTPHIRTRSRSTSQQQDVRRSSATLAPPVPTKDDIKPIIPQVQSINVAATELLDSVVQPKHRHILLPMAVGYDMNDDLNTPWNKSQGQIASWLLDGEVYQPFLSFDSVEPMTNDETACDLGSVPPTSAIKSSLVTPDHDGIDLISRAQSPETYASADDRLQDSPRQDSTSFTLRRRGSNQESVRSTYRDASESQSVS